MSNHTETTETPLARLVDMHVAAASPTTLDSVLSFCAEQWAGGRPNRDTVARILADPGRYRIADRTDDGRPMFERRGR